VAGRLGTTDDSVRAWRHRFEAEGVVGMASITERRIRRGAFTLAPDPIESIQLWGEHWNDDPKPFVWHEPAQEINEKVRPGRARLGQVESVTAD
jgi:hypothetical protein